MSLLTLSLLLASTVTQPPAGASFLYQPAFRMDYDLRCPAEPYCPQPGDLFLASDRAFIGMYGHRLAGSGCPHHSGIVLALPDGTMAILESGPFNGVRVEVTEAVSHLRSYEDKGERVWVRRRAVPLTPEQSAKLTAFALEQNGKPFATWRLLGQATPLRSRGWFTIHFMGKPKGTRSTYFCSELVMECCVAAGLVNPDTARPAATYPRELYYGRSDNAYLDKTLDINAAWCPPARWTACP